MYEKGIDLIADDKTANFLVLHNCKYFTPFYRMQANFQHHHFESRHSEILVDL